MSFPAKILFAAITFAFCLGAGAPAMALMPAPSYSLALNTVKTSSPVEEVRYGHHRKRYYKRGGRRYGGYRRYRPGIGIYIAPPPVYVAPPVYGSPRNQCDYWASQCAANWSRRSDYIGCMRYEGCY